MSAAPCPDAGPSMIAVVFGGLLVLWIGVGLPALAVWLWFRFRDERGN